MIVMLIAGSSGNEIRYIAASSKSLAARYSEESWDMKVCHGYKELEKAVSQELKIEMMCVDLTIPNTLELTKKLREWNKTAYMILIASPSMSPVTYMRPSICAESLMLKPLTKEQVKSVLTEAFQAFIKRFSSPDEEQVFVIENKEGRILVEYDRICFFEARDKKVYLNTGAKEYAFYGTLDKLQKQLTGQFIRCHRGFLVNKKKIEKIMLSRNVVLLEGSFEIPVSRTCKASLKEYTNI